MYESYAIVEANGNGLKKDLCIRIGTAFENNDGSINSEYLEGYPFVTPDESYLIVFSHKRPGGFGSIDLYISFRREDSSCGKAVNMGESVNMEIDDNLTMVSPYGEYFFFVSNRNGNYDVYWMSASIIHECARLLHNRAVDSCCILPILN